MNQTIKIFGPPGTGKTTRLLNEVANYLARGFQPEEIGFVSFTRQAAEEAKSRAHVRFGFSRKRLLNFRTLHSMAFGMLALNRESVIKTEHYQEIARACGFEVSARAARMNSEEGLWIGATRGDKILFLENMARISSSSIDSVLETSEFDDIEKLEVEVWAKALKSFKEANALMDFTDMLNDWLKHGTVPFLKVLFVDEAQDLSRLQWHMVRKMAQQSLDLWLAGDDDQAIFRWSGASPDEFVNFPGETVVLHQSYRVPKVVHALAMDIRANIDGSLPKEYAPREEQGLLDFYDELEQVDMSEGKWLVLVRNNYLVSMVEENCRRLGFWYDSLFDPPTKCTRPILNWHRFLKGERLTITEMEEVLKMCGRTINIKKEYDKSEFLQDYEREERTISEAITESRPWFDVFQDMSVEKRTYYRSVLARKEDIRGTPRIRISTIHGAKGGEEDNVVLITDMSNKTYEKMAIDLSNEHRVFYVAVTRAKVTLHVVKPQT